MARKSPVIRDYLVSKSQLVRDYLVKHPDLGPTDLAALIKQEQKVEVTPGLVTTVKGHMNRKQSAASVTRHAAATQLAAKTGRAPSEQFLEALRALHGCIRALGGPEATKDAVDLLTSLASRPT